MNRNYTTGTSDSAKMFLGREVEHTPAIGQKTLFVVGYQTVEEIEKLLADPYVSIKDQITHIYFGANHSFNPKWSDEWTQWENLISTFLIRGFWCTLDFDVQYAESLLESNLIEYNCFIPMVSVRLPYIRQFNYNTVIKLDDRDFADSNPGVWCHSLHDLMNRECFTDWSKYSQDEILK